MNRERDCGSREKQLGRTSWKMTENAIRDIMKWQKLPSGLVHQPAWEADKYVPGL